MVVMGFVLIAWTRFLLTENHSIAAIACLICVTIWGLRLGIVLHQRTKKRGEDPRYVRMRETAGSNWWWISFLQVFMLQGILLLMKIFVITMKFLKNYLKNTVEQLKLLLK